MHKLTEAQRRKAIQRGYLLLPTELSWRRADQLRHLGYGTIYPFHQRWQGRLDFTDAGRLALSSPAPRREP